MALKTLSVYASSLGVGVGSQILGLLLLPIIGGDPEGTFRFLPLVSWCVFWICVFTLMTFRAKPTKLELVLLAIGPLIVLIGEVLICRPVQRGG